MMIGVAVLLVVGAVVGVKMLGSGDGKKEPGT